MGGKCLQWLLTHYVGSAGQCWKEQIVKVYFLFSLKHVRLFRNTAQWNPALAGA